MTDEPLDNALVHLGRGPDTDGRHVNLPIVQGSTMLFNSLKAFETARDNRFQHGTQYYGRYGHEASFELERMICDLEGGHGCITVSAGLSAVCFALTGATKAGDHLLVADNVYVPTRSFCDLVLAKYGVEIEYFDPMLGGGIASMMRPNTSAVMFEAPGSGTFEVPDIPAIAKAARDGGALSIIDGTWATPVFCRPLSLGVDVVAHSASKYICGHSDAMLGLIVCNEATYDLMRRTCISFGERSGSQDIFLALRGLRTLGMRMQHAQTAGMKVATWLAAQKPVRRVLHPAFPDCPGHEHWKASFSGASGLFSIVLQDCPDEQLHRFVDGLKMFNIGVSWGGYESLVLPVDPVRTATSWTESGRLVRLNIGHENTDDLIADLAQALDRFNLT